MNAPRVFEITPEGELICNNGEDPKERLKAHYKNYLKSIDDKTVCITSSRTMDYLLQCKLIAENMGA